MSGEVDQAERSVQADEQVVLRGGLVRVRRVHICRPGPVFRMGHGVSLDNLVPACAVGRDRQVGFRCHFESSGSASGSGQAGSANANTKMQKKKVDCRPLKEALRESPFAGLTKNQTKETVPSVILGVQGGPQDRCILRAPGID